MAEITRNMSLMELLQTYPRAREVLERHGMPCESCMGVELETIERGARMHGIDIQTLLKELNQELLGKGS